MLQGVIKETLMQQKDMNTQKQKKNTEYSVYSLLITVRNEATYAVVIMSRSFPANYFPTNCNMEFQNSVGINI